MKASTTMAMAAIGGTTVGLAGVAAAVAARRARLPAADRIVHITADELRYEEVVPGASMGVLRGDPQRGAHATFTRFQPGFRVARHIHTHDITLVVVRGAYIFGLDGESEARRVEAGSYLLIPAGTPHWSGGDATEGALMLQESTGSFDLRILE
jgi:quercetin dioxygenase-like cupin family protein